MSAHSSDYTDVDEGIGEFAPKDWPCNVEGCTRPREEGCEDCRIHCWLDAWQSGDLELAAEWFGAVGLGLGRLSRRERRVSGRRASSCLTRRRWQWSVPAKR